MYVLRYSLRILLVLGTLPRLRNYLCNGLLQRVEKYGGRDAFQCALGSDFRSNNIYIMDVRRLLLAYVCF